MKMKMTSPMLVRVVLMMATLCAVGDAQAAGCPQLPQQCSYIQQVVCDGTTHWFSGKYQHADMDLASLRYSISYNGKRNIVVSTCNTANLDTQLALFDCAALSQVETAANGTCGKYIEDSLYDNDDAAGCCLTSKLKILVGELESGTYIIGVCSYDGNGGGFTVTIFC
ncbi:uncharacterized protein LOC106151705 [Lingula anatina]|uniref:Uncharacterized protein LOC106151705 n=1 Tax=Lingula anatina TaxID=7574 RepID=A0A1S3H4Z8_LINAN|nr:uncharacterized protein LOC106151705 [Lingula anatina]|eukprot:XP_013380541.1 uncharacterized protein LOC106151705 [Lingula anatina]